MFSRLFVNSVVCSMFAILSPGTANAGIVTFGTDSNQFQIEFVTIGNPNNPDDTTGSPSQVGSVAYTYGIAKYETSEQMIAVYNALAPNKVNSSTWGANKPVTSISWHEAARFVNWLNTSKGYGPAYRFLADGGTNTDANRALSNSIWDPSDALNYDASNPMRSRQAKYVLPSYDEWYKAAYYDPDTGTYFDYPTANGSAPTITTGGTTPNTAVFSDGPYNERTSPADIDKAGGLSPYGVMAMAGNVLELEETSYDLINNLQHQYRASRGGWFKTGSWGGTSITDMSSSTRNQTEAGYRDF
ncbi:MAG: SUMF1/EgtB/PvdO family nonheme iron enzyme, partial [Pirellula sp.]